MGDLQFFRRQRRARGVPTTASNERRSGVLGRSQKRRVKAVSFLGERTRRVRETSLHEEERSRKTPAGSGKRAATMGLLLFSGSQRRRGERELLWLKGGERERNFTAKPLNLNLILFPSLISSLPLLFSSSCSHPRRQRRRDHILFESSSVFFFYEKSLISNSLEKRIHAEREKKRKRKSTALVAGELALSLFLLRKKKTKNHKQAARCLHTSSAESHSNSLGGSTAVIPACDTGDSIASPPGNESSWRSLATTTAGVGGAKSFEFSFPVLVFPTESSDI